MPKPNFNLIAGVDDKLLGKAGNADNDVSNLTDSPAPGFQNLLQKFYLNLDKLDVDSLNSLGSSIVVSTV